MRGLTVKNSGCIGRGTAADWERSTQITSSQYWDVVRTSCVVYVCTTYTLLIKLYIMSCRNIRVTVLYYAPPLIGGALLLSDVCRVHRESLLGEGQVYTGSARPRTQVNWARSATVFFGSAHTVCCSNLILYSEWQYRKATWTRDPRRFRHTKTDRCGIKYRPTDARFFCGG